jgi:hypothetical protein
LFELRVLVQADHFLDDLVSASVKERVVFIDLRVVARLLNDPLLLLGVELALELARVFEDGALARVVVTVPDVVGALGDVLRTADVVRDQGQTVGAQTLEFLGVEPTILDRAVVPLGLSRGVRGVRSELKLVVEEVLAFNELAAVPLGDVAATMRVNKGAVAMELALVKVSLVDDPVGEGELTEALVPALLSRALVLAAAPL